MRTAWLAVCAVLVASPPAAAQDTPKPITIIAAENFYGDIARQIGGEAVTVTSILRNPDQDPHLFEVSPSTARLLADATLVVYNGAGYDPWMEALLAASEGKVRQVIVVADLMDRQSGDNPHLWYDPATMPALATALAERLSEIDPAHRAAYRDRLSAFLRSVEPLDDKIREIRANYAGVSATATEPVFGYMAEALGLKMRNEEFQRAVMNDTEPSASAIASFQDDLTSGAVRVLIYNRQVTDTMTERLLAIAKDSHVPVVGITETQPDGVSYQAWIMSELDALEEALSRGS